MTRFTRAPKPFKLIGTACLAPPGRSSCPEWRAWTAGRLAGLGTALFGLAAFLLKAGAVTWDVSLFRVLNEVPPAAAAVLTPLSHLFLPAGIIAVVVLTVVYVVARNRGALPVVAGAVAPVPHGR